MLGSTQLKSRRTLTCAVQLSLCHLHSHCVICSCITSYALYMFITFSHGDAGEVVWMRRILDKYHEAAKQQGVRIVHCCGFDSVPSDLGACLVVDHLDRLGKYSSPLSPFSCALPRSSLPITATKCTLKLARSCLWFMIPVSAGIACCSS